MIVIYAINGRVENLKLYRVTLDGVYSFVELSLPDESGMRPAEVERHARWLEFSGRDMFSIAMPERDAYYVHLFSDSTESKLPILMQHAVTLQCLLAVAKHHEYTVVDSAFSDQIHSWDTDVRTMAQYLWNAYCRRTPSETFLNALASFRADEILPFLTAAYNDMLAFRKKLAELTSARCVWELSVKDVTGLVCECGL